MPLNNTNVDYVEVNVSVSRVMAFTFRWFDSNFGSLILVYTKTFCEVYSLYYNSVLENIDFVLENKIRK